MRLRNGRAPGPVLVLVGAGLVLALSGCLGGPTTDGAPADASGGPAAEELRTAALDTDRPTSYGFSVRTRAAVAWPASLDGGGPTRYGVAGSGTVDRDPGIVNATWAVETGLSLGGDTTWDITQENVTTVAANGTRYERRGYGEDWDADALDRDVAAYDKLAALHRMLANASVRRGGERRIGDETLPVLALDLPDGRAPHAVAVASSHLALATRTDFGDADLGPWTVDSLNVTLTVEPSTGRVRRSRIAANASVPVPDGDGGRYDVEDVTTYRRHDAVDTSIPAVSPDDAAPTGAVDDPAHSAEAPATGEGGTSRSSADESEALEPEINVDFSDQSHYARAAYVAADPPHNVTVTFSGWGDEASARLAIPTHRATLTTEGFTVFGGTVLREPTALPRAGATVEVTAVVERDGERTEILTDEGGI